MTMETQVVVGADISRMKAQFGEAAREVQAFGSRITGAFRGIRDALGNIGNIVAAVGAVKLTGLADEAALLLGEQPGVLDGDGRLPGERFEKAQILGGMLGQVLRIDVDDTDEPTLRAQLAEIRTTGVAVTTGEYDQGIIGIGRAAVVANEVVGAFSVAFPATRDSDALRARIRDLLTRVVQLLESS